MLIELGNSTSSFHANTQWRDQHQTVPDETLRQVFDVCRRPSIRHAAEASPPRAAQTKVNEQTQRRMELFDSCDVEHRWERDVYQIGKYLQREHHPTLSDEVIGDH